jgi:peptidoglycan hydrolase-like protein with peptidoglycan-binding domain
MAFGLMVSVLGAEAAVSQSTKQIRENQEMLIWTGDYNGVVDGLLGNDTKQAVKTFQKRLGHIETGELTGIETTLLRKQGREAKLAVGFDRVDDTLTGVSVGMPLKLVSGPKKMTYGQNWSAPDDSINIDTFRYSGVTLRQVFNRLMGFHDRRVDYFRLTDEWFVVSGIDRDNAEIYVRAAEKKATEKGDLPEIRGFSLRLVGRKDQLKGLTTAMSSSFALIPVGQKPAGPPQDLLRTTTEELLKGKNASPGVTSSTGCFNGLGNCPPSVNSCLNGSSECPPSLKGK